MWPVSRKRRPAVGLTRSTRCRPLACPISRPPASTRVTGAGSRSAIPPGSEANASASSSACRASPARLPVPLLIALHRSVRASIAGWSIGAISLRSRSVSCFICNERRTPRRPPVKPISRCDACIARGEAGKEERALSERVDRSGLQVDAALAQFLEAEVLAPLERDAAAFWAGFADLLREFSPRNLALLEKRDALQAKI